MAWGPWATRSVNSPYWIWANESVSSTWNESVTKSRMADSMPETMSVSWATTLGATASCSKSPVSRWIKSTCSTRKTSVFSSTTSPKGREVRQASSLQPRLRGLKLISKAWLKRCVIAAREFAIERRIAGPMIG